MRATFLQLPDVDNKEELTRFLSRVIEILDIIYGNRGDKPLAAKTDVISTASSVASLREDVNALDGRFVKLDSSNLDTLHYKQGTALPDDLTLINIDMLKTKVVNTSVNTLEPTASNEDIINKVNELINILNSAQLLQI